MKFSWIGLVRFQPFDEECDSASYGEGSRIPLVLPLLVVASAFLVVAGLLLALAGYPLTASPILLVAAATSAVTAGVEWNAGMKARALNQLFVAVLAVCLLVVLAS